MTMKKIFVRSAFNYDIAAASKQSATHPAGDSLTLQSEAAATDINLIIQNWTRTGIMPTSSRQPRFGDFTEVNDFQSALHAVQDAQETFNQLPPSIRSKFHNNPQYLYDFITNPQNKKQAQDLGLLPPDAPTAPAASSAHPSPSQMASDMKASPAPSQAQPAQSST